MRPPDATVPRRWSFRCTRCDHSYRTIATTGTAAALAARTNGWIIDRATVCPSCASVAARRVGPVRAVAV
jgi:hypothetical protein